MSPTKGRHFGFDVDPVGFCVHIACFVFLRYVLNHWIHFDQTCNDKLLRGRAETL